MNDKRVPLDEAAPGLTPEESDAEAQRVLLHVPVDIRSVSLAVLAVLASLFALHWAKGVVVPILLGVMFSYALAPTVDLLQRWRLPRPIGAALVSMGAVALIGWGVYSLTDDADALIATLPEVAQKARRVLQDKQASKPSAIDKVQQAANELEKVASAGAGAATGRTPPPPPPPPRVNVADFLWSSTLGLIAFLGQATVVFFITLFLLASGDTFRRKMVKLAGPRLSQKKITIQALDEISAHIQRFLFVQLATSAVVGVATGLAFYLIGLEHAAVWGLAAGVTNLIPYVGAVIVGVGASIVGFMQFNAIDMGLFVGGVSFAIHAVVGNVLTPWWTGRSSRMNAFAVFVGVLAFGWLWGVSGLLLGTPILMVVKTICDRIEDLKPVGEFLGA
ncbi:MAG TPA: AI-2E family transporter [Caldimonas sp.]|jgi:predicted PurR-regulated permease PerM|nr:AI-2E family transporter [Caldimonas sp.]HEX2539616.1 AI-2E family transporter [Caldimonas sp.]